MGEEIQNIVACRKALDLVMANVFKAKFYEFAKIGFKSKRKVKSVYWWFNTNLDRRYYVNGFCVSDIFVTYDSRGSVIEENIADSDYADDAFFELESFLYGEYCQYFFEVFKDKKVVVHRNGDVDILEQQNDK